MTELLITQNASSLRWECIFLLQFMGGYAILKSSGMVNEFQGCIARIPNLAKARFAGFVCCIHLQLSEKVIVYV